MTTNDVVDHLAQVLERERVERVEKLPGSYGSVLHAEWRTSPSDAHVVDGLDARAVLEAEDGIADLNRREDELGAKGAMSHVRTDSKAGRREQSYHPRRLPVSDRAAPARERLEHAADILDVLEVQLDGVDRVLCEGGGQCESPRP